MEDIIITENNKEAYKKLIAIKEGKTTSNSICIFIPIILLILESIVLSSLILYSPFIETIFNLTKLATPTKLLLFGVSLYTSVKLNISLSKIMSLTYLKKDNPNINIKANPKKVKIKLKEYNSNKVQIYSVKKVKKKSNISLNEKIEFLEHEKEFLKKYQKALEEDLIKEKTLKYKK